MGCEAICHHVESLSAEWRNNEVKVAVGEEKLYKRKEMWIRTGGVREAKRPEGGSETERERE